MMGVAVVAGQEVPAPHHQRHAYSCCDSQHEPGKHVEAWQDVQWAQCGAVS